MVPSKDLNGPPPVEGKVSGLYNGFEAYRTPTETDYRTVLSNGLVVPDANVLLNLYRYNEQTRSDLFAVMRGLGDSLWVPHWVMAEFWRNRENVLQDPKNTAITERELFNSRDKANDIVRSWAHRVGLAGDRIMELTDTLSEAFSSVAENVRQLADLDATEFARDTYKDPVLQRLELLLRDRVGPPFTRDEHKNALADAKIRFEEKRPPGYKDAEKGIDKGAGDYFIWLQVMLEARRVNRDVLIVTGDIKEDWWRREHGEVRGPHPELVQELKNFANVQFFMMRPESLLLQARKILRIRIRDESLQDVERIDREQENWRDWEDNDGEETLLDIEKIRYNWDPIVDQVKPTRRVAWILLQNSLPTKYDGTTLTVEFRREGDLRGFTSSSCDRDLAQVMHRLFGVHIEVDGTCSA